MCIRDSLDREVGAAGLEPTTSSTPLKRATKLRHAPTARSIISAQVLDGKRLASVSSVFHFSSYQRLQVGDQQAEQAQGEVVAGVDEDGHGGVAALADDAQDDAEQEDGQHGRAEAVLDVADGEDERRGHNAEDGLERAAEQQLLAQPGGGGQQEPLADGVEAAQQRLVEACLLYTSPSPRD